MEASLFYVYKLAYLPLLKYQVKLRVFTYRLYKGLV